MQVETRDLRDFTRIKACCGFEVELMEGDFEVRVEAESNLLEYVKTEVNGSELSLGWKQNTNINTNETVRIFISLPKLQGLDGSSGCDFSGKSVFYGEDLNLEASSAATIALEFEGEEVEASASSGARISLAGKGREIDADASSGSAVEASGFLTEDARADASSGARVEVSASRKLRADASSGARVRYGGNPADMDTDASSGGSVRKY